MQSFLYMTARDNDRFLDIGLQLRLRVRGSYSMRLQTELKDFMHWYVDLWSILLQIILIPSTSVGILCRGYHVVIQTEQSSIHVHIVKHAHVSCVVIEPSASPYRSTMFRKDTSMVQSHILR